MQAPFERSDRGLMSYYTVLITLCWMALGVLCILVHENSWIPKKDKHRFYLTYGIIGAARCIEQVIADAGRCYRTGGDEFVVMTHMCREEAQELLDRLDEETKRWSKNNPAFSLSIAPGYVRAEDYHDYTIEEIVKKADQAMYAAKAAYYLNRG